MEKITEMPRDDREIKLRVVEALQDDAYKGIARIDLELMKQLGLRRGDIISIKGARETVAVVDRAYPADLGERIVRIDGIIRKNAKTSIGESVTIKKAQIKEAKKITIAPAQKDIMVQGDPNGIKTSLLGRAVVKGDILVLGGAKRRRDLMSDFDDLPGIFGDLMGQMGMGVPTGLGLGGINQIRFYVTSATPAQACIITENTELTLLNKAVDILEDNGSFTKSEVTYEDIGGLTDEVKKIREMVELPLKHPEIFEKLGIEPPKGVLLHGPPGTGKTMLAKAVAHESDANFILLNGPEIMSKFYGESEKNLRSKFEEAEKNAPSIIFIDEIDAIASKREESQGEVERRVVSQLLTLMDGLNSRGKVVVIAATNRPNSIDPALRRPGRFDREVSINVPNQTGRLAILKIHARNMPIRYFNEGVAEKVLTQKIDSFESQSKEKIDEIKEKINKNKESLSELNKKVKSYESSKEQVKDVIKTLSREISRAENERERFGEDNNPSIFRKLTSFLREKRFDLENLNQELSKFQDKLTKNNEEIESLNSKINKEEKEIKLLKDHILLINKVSEDLKSDKSHIKTLVSQLHNNYLEKNDLKHQSSVLELSDPRKIYVSNALEQKNKETEILKESLSKTGILGKDLEEKINHDSVEVLLKDFAAKTHGFVGADLASLARESAMSVLRRLIPDLKIDEDVIPEEIMNKAIITENDFMEAIKFVRPSAMREVLIETPNVGWDDVGGLDQIRRRLQESVEWPLKNPQIFSKMGIRPPRGILLYGPPGTGKTLLAKAVAKESQANFISVKGPELLSKWVNETPQLVKKLFERARQVSPCIIFFDEIDSLAYKREYNSNSHSGMDAINQLLTEIDGMEQLTNVIVIGATNRPDILDPAILRPGRFDRLLLVGTPTKEGREKIFDIHTKSMPLAKDVDKKKLALETEGYVGADIESLCREAAMISLREGMKSGDLEEVEHMVAKEVTMKHFEEAMKKVPASVSKVAAERYSKMEEEYLKNARAALTPEVKSYLG